MFCGGIAQLARVLGSYPIGRWFEPNCRYHIAAGSFKGVGVCGPMVKRPKTSPFHGGNSGSNPDGVTKDGGLKVF